MSALHPSIDLAHSGSRASGSSSAAEALSALGPGGKKKKAGASSGAENPFAALLAKAGEALRAAQAAASKAGGKAGEPAEAALALAKAGTKAALAPQGKKPATPNAVLGAHPGAAAANAVASAAKAETPKVEGASPSRAEGSSKRDASKAKARDESLLEAAPREGTPAARLAKAAFVNPGAEAEGADNRDNPADGAKGRKAGEPRVGMVDLRRSAAARKEASAKASEAEGIANRDEAQGPRREIVRELGVSPSALASGERSAGADKPEAARRSAAGSDFATLLAQRLRESGNGEIVQAAHIILKDGDAGTIRLKLRPESLGDVKIELNLSDKSISGKIVVESDEAKNAFERNMAELNDAFRQGGFETASLEVSVGSGSKREAGGQDSPDSRPFFSERLRAADAVAGPVSAGAYARRGGAVDILA